MKKIGTRHQVYHGKAESTSGGLTKAMLVRNVTGRIVSKKKQITARTNKNPLAPYLQKKRKPKKPVKKPKPKKKVKFKSEINPENILKSKRRKK